MAKLKWCGNPPKACDLCKQPIIDVFIDGKMRDGPWASMCSDCHNDHGVGCGVGRGQKYQRQGDGSFQKVEG